MEPLIVIGLIVATSITLAAVALSVFRKEEQTNDGEVIVATEDTSAGLVRKNVRVIRSGYRKGVYSESWYYLGEINLLNAPILYTVIEDLMDDSAVDAKCLSSHSERIANDEPSDFYESSYDTGGSYDSESYDSGSYDSDDDDW